MATSEAGEFERALARLEEIVTTLEGEGVSLDDSVRLYEEGRKLSRRCETLLRAAQESIAAAASEEDVEDDRSAPPVAIVTPVAPRNGNRSSLFDEELLDDDVPF
jgi:exodeoxyribonuclease VII small subunit